jgi:hypothetical protein
MPKPNPNRFAVGIMAGADVSDQRGQHPAPIDVSKPAFRHLDSRRWSRGRIITLSKPAEIKGGDDGDD